MDEDENCLDDDESGEDKNIITESDTDESINYDKEDGREENIIDNPGPFMDKDVNSSIEPLMETSTFVDRVTYSSPPAADDEKIGKNKKKTKK